MENEAKMKVLKEIVAMMDQKQVDGLKSKSPKFMKVETNDPEMAKEVVQEAVEQETEPTNPMDDMMEDKLETEVPESEDEDMKRLMELYNQLK